jgi:hypothetical protein
MPAFSAGPVGECQPLNSVLYDTLYEQASGTFTHSQKEVLMMKKCKSIIAVLAMIALIVGLSGCEKEGPMEKAGKKVDKAIEDIKK